MMYNKLLCEYIVRIINEGRASTLTPEIKELLGTVPDAEIAREYGASLATIWNWRKKYNIPRYVNTEKLSKLTPEIMKLLGKLSDIKIAKMADVDAATVRRLRLRLGINSQQAGGRRPRSPTPEIVALLGKVSDDKISKQFNVSPEIVRRWHTEHDTPKYEWDRRKQRELTPEIIALLGKATDKTIAQQLGVSAATVGKWRFNYNIKSVGYEDARFIRVWNAANNLEQVADKLQITKTVASTRASELRKKGIELKTFLQQSFFDAHGITKDDFIEFYNEIGPTELAKLLGVTNTKVAMFASEFRKKYPDKVKRHNALLPISSNKEFIDYWNTADDIADVVSHFGLESRTQASKKAIALRAQGHELKDMHASPSTKPHARVHTGRSALLSDKGENWYLRDTDLANKFAAIWNSSKSAKDATTVFFGEPNPNADDVYYLTGVAAKLRTGGKFMRYFGKPSQLGARK